MKGVVALGKRCPNCGSDLPEEASFCLDCFTPLNVTPIITKESSKKQPKGIIYLILAIVFVSALVSVLIVSTTAKKQDNSTTQSTTTAAAMAIKVTTSKQSTTKKTVSTEKSTATDSTAETESTTTSTTESTTKATTTTKPTTTKKKSTTKAVTTTKRAITTEKTTTPSVVINEGTLVSYPPDKTSSTYKIPYNVKKINNNAFNNKYIKTIKFSKRETVECDWANLFSCLPNLKTVYVYPGTSADLEGLQYFDGEIVYYD